FTALRPGIAILDTTTESGARLVVVRINPRVAHLHLATIARLGDAGLSLPEFLARDHAAVVLSGGFSKTFFPPVPVGLVRVNGRTINRQSSDPILDGAIAIRGSSVVIDTVGSPRTARGTDALQAGPWFLANGRWRDSRSSKNLSVLTNRPFER